MLFRHRTSPRPQQTASVMLLSIACPHCQTPLARVARDPGSNVPGRDVVACFTCGLFGGYRALSERGVLDGGMLSAQEIGDFRAELSGLPS